MKEQTSMMALEHAPELTWDELRTIKVPTDLFEILSFELCKKLKIIPLRYEPTHGIFSFAFVESKIEKELKEVGQKKGWGHLAGLHISEQTFERLMSQCEQAEHDPFPTQVALIEPDLNLRNALLTLLQKQNMEVVLFDHETKFLERATLWAKKLNNEDHLLDLSSSHKTLLFQNVLVRKSVLKDPQQFIKKVQSMITFLSIHILEENWLQPLLSKSVRGSDLEFHLHHANYYQAALECLKQGHFFQAVELLHKVKPENMHFIKAKILLGKVFLSKKNYEKAIEHFRKAYSTWCENAESIVDETVIKLFYHLGLTFEKLSRNDDAIKFYERTAGENPNYKDVQARLEVIKERQRRFQRAHEKKMGLPAFSRGIRDQARYEKIEQIGRGGMGLVYRARDRVLGREVALKVLNSHFKHDEKIVETFLREAKSLAALNHLHIVTVFDAGIEEGNYYISMEFIEGKTVRDILKKRGHFRLPTVLSIAKQVLKALAYAHSKHVIHRDITTNNMMLTEAKIIKLTDFGLARIVNQLHSDQSIIGGTPYFMSPEQVEGAPIDHRTDLYSFGVCLFEMLTGQVPFPMENPGYHHLHTLPPRLESIKPDCSTKMGDIIALCLEKKPENRLQTAEEILMALKDISETNEPTLMVHQKRNL